MKKSFLGKKRQTLRDILWVVAQYYQNPTSQPLPKGLLFSMQQLVPSHRFACEREQGGVGEL